MFYDLLSLTNDCAGDFNAIDAEWSAIDGASTRAMSKPELQASAAVLELWRQRERDLRLTIEAKNTLESFVYECKDLLRRVASDNAQMNTDTNSDNDDGDDDGTIKPHNVFVDDIDGVNALVTQLEATIDWLDVYIILFSSIFFKNLNYFAICFLFFCFFIVIG